jgi:hypothetical protein
MGGSVSLSFDGEQFGAGLWMLAESMVGSWVLAGGDEPGQIIDVVGEDEPYWVIEFGPQARWMLSVRAGLLSFG